MSNPTASDLQMHDRPMPPAIDLEAAELVRTSTLVVRVRNSNRANKRIRRWMWLLRFCARRMGLRTAEIYAVRHLRKNTAGDEWDLRSRV